MSLEASIRAFADETGIFGMHMFKRQRSRIEVVFWCALVAAFACYTAKSVVDISVKYVAEETITSVYQKSQEVIYFPNPLLCLYGEPVVSGIRSRDMPTEVILEEFLGIFDLNASNFLYVVNFLRELHELELSAIPQAHDSDAASMKSALKTIPDVVPILHAIALRSSNLLTSISDFVFLKLCNVLQMRLTFKKDTDVAESYPLACKQEDIFIPSDANENAIASICVKLDRKPFSFGSGSDSVDIELRFNATTLSEIVGLDETTTNVYFICDGHYHLSGGAITDYDSIFEIFSQTRRRYYVGLTAVYDNLDLQRRRCDPDSDRSARCKGECESRFFFESHGCWPSMFVGQPGQNSTTVRRCQAIDYLTNLTFASWNSAAIKRLLECRSRCFERCSKPLFSVNSHSSLQNEITIATIFVQSHVYTHVDERLANDFESFLSSLGGVLGLWLGASFASIIHIPIFLIQSLIGSFRSRKKGQGVPASTEMASGPEAGGVSTTDEKLEAHDKTLLQLTAQIAELTSRLRALEES